MGRVIRAKAISPFVGQKMTNFLGRPKAEDLFVLKDLIEAGKATPVIGTRFPLSNVPDAIRELGTGQRGARSSSPCEVPALAQIAEIWPHLGPAIIPPLSLCGPN